MSDVTTNDLKKIADSSELGLSDLLDCVKILDVSEKKFSDNMTMKQINQELKNHILNEVHPYKIYSSGNKGHWFTYVHDVTCPRGRRLIKRTTYDSLVDTLINHYRERSRMDIKMRELFEE